MARKAWKVTTNLEVENAKKAGWLTAAITGYSAGGGVNIYNTRTVVAGGSGITPKL